MQSYRPLASVFIERLTSSKTIFQRPFIKSVPGTVLFHLWIYRFQYADVYSECVRKNKSKNCTVTFPIFYSVREFRVVVLAVHASVQTVSPGC